MPEVEEPVYHTDDIVTGPMRQVDAGNLYQICEMRNGQAAEQCNAISNDYLKPNDTFPAWAGRFLLEQAEIKLHFCPHSNIRPNLLPGIYEIKSSQTEFYFLGDYHHGWPLVYYTSKTDLQIAKPLMADRTTAWVPYDRGAFITIPSLLSPVSLKRHLEVVEDFTNYWNYLTKMMRAIKGPIRRDRVSTGKLMARLKDYKEKVISSKDIEAIIKSLI